MDAHLADRADLASTGIAGLDSLLHGGLQRRRSYLVRGFSGTGKTTLAMQWMMTGAQQGERTLFFTLSETLDEMQQVARSHGWSLDGVQIHELVPMTVSHATARQTVFPAPDVELDELITEMMHRIEEVRPNRVVLDSITEIRLLAASPLRYRQQLLTLRQRLFEANCTSLLLTNEQRDDSEATLDSIVHGIITLSRDTPEYGATKRRLELTKLRGLDYPEGYHDYRIITGGLEVYPRLPLGSAPANPGWEALSSGLPELDALVGGGLETSTAALIMGQAGTGKSTIAMLYANAAIRRGERVAVFLFDERVETWLHRANALGMDLGAAFAGGSVHLRQVNTGELSPGEFTYLVRTMVDQNEAKIVVIDSLSGYVNAMPGEKLVVNQMHELLIYLGHRGVLSLMVLTQHGLFSTITHDPLDMSYLADTVLLLRHFESDGTVRQAISAVKKRYAAHERTIRELRISADGVRIGAPLTEFRGVLTGYPQFEGGGHTLLGTDPASPAPRNAAEEKHEPAA